MKLVVTFLFIVIMTTGLLSNPVFVVASDICYVDENANDDGDGNSDDPYQNIKKALNDDCEDIVVKKGTYEEDIVMNDNVRIDGVNRDDVVITGQVIMKEKSEISNLTISTSSVNIESDADATIDNLNIEKANIGINTKGNGKLTVKNVSLYDNQKAMYLQGGVDVDITNNKIYDNDTKGIDIKDGTEGIISNNSIYDNGDGGIAVVVGESKLEITNNTIKKNKTSGIIVMYYKNISKSDNVKIKDNKITRNKKFGIDCRALSGGNPGKEYWTKSMGVSENKVFDNEDGDFSDTCSIESKEISNTVNSEEQMKKQKLLKLQQERESKAATEQKKKLREAKMQQEQDKKAEQKKKSEQESLRSKLQQRMNLQGKVNKLKQEVDEFYSVDSLSQEKIENRPGILIFFIGPDYKELRSMAERIGRYDAKIQEARKIKSTVTDEAIKKRMQEDIEAMIQKKSLVYNFIKQLNDEFSLFGWFFKKKI